MSAIRSLRSLCAARHLLASLLVLAGTAAPAAAAELVVHSVGAMRAVVSELAEVFRRETGHTVRLTVAPDGTTQALIEGAAQADLVIAPQAMVNSLAARGLALAEASHPIARTGKAREAVPSAGEAAPVITYVAAPTPRGADAALVQGFVELLTRPAMRPRFAAAGLDVQAP
ncbi:MAG: substrate-binding domain-containing protein [Burkholderiales bacterium]|nr:substrate-binding domain-containing protein [Burkholderiales bacterium]